MSLDAMCIKAMCEDCALEIYGTTAPTPRYADAVGRLLLGTAAQESALHWRRQRTPAWDGPVGGFSLWQVEYRASVVPSLEYLLRREDVRERATRWLWQDKRATDAWVKADQDAMLWMLRGWDRLGCLMARLHYMRVASAVPTTLEGQARYWKTYYNTSAGKGRVEQYIDNWWEFAAPMYEADSDAA